MEGKGLLRGAGSFVGRTCAKEEVGARLDPSWLTERLCRTACYGETGRGDAMLHRRRLQDPSPTQKAATRASPEKREGVALFAASRAPKQPWAIGYALHKTRKLFGQDIGCFHSYPNEAEVELACNHSLLSSAASFAMRVTVTPAESGSDSELNRVASDCNDFEQCCCAANNTADEEEWFDLGTLSDVFQHGALSVVIALLDVVICYSGSAERCFEAALLTWTTAQ